LYFKIKYLYLTYIKLKLSPIQNKYYNYKKYKLAMTTHPLATCYTNDNLPK
jgi:hypothetical protein